MVQGTAIGGGLETSGYVGTKAGDGGRDPGVCVGERGGLDSLDGVRVVGHTPGPWHVSEDWSVRCPEDACPSPGHRACVVADAPLYGDEDHDARRKADLKLIAAAPELLHEAWHAVAFLEDLEASDNPACDPESYQATGFHGALSGLRAAIAKAEGK